MDNNYHELIKIEGYDRIDWKNVIASDFKYVSIEINANRYAGYLLKENECTYVIAVALHGDNAWDYNSYYNLSCKFDIMKFNKNAIGFYRTHTQWHYNSDGILDTRTMEQIAIDSINASKNATF